MAIEGDLYLQHRHHSWWRRRMRRSAQRGVQKYIRQRKKYEQIWNAGSVHNNKWHENVYKYLLWRDSGRCGICADKLSRNQQQIHKKRQGARIARIANTKSGKFYDEDGLLWNGKGDDLDNSEIVHSHCNKGGLSVMGRRSVKLDSLPFAVRTTVRRERICCWNPPLPPEESLGLSTIADPFGSELY